MSDSIKVVKVLVQTYDGTLLLQLHLSLVHCAFFCIYNEYKRKENKN